MYLFFTLCLRKNDDLGIANFEHLKAFVADMRKPLPDLEM